jgi:ASC-1-like (ASCH) protein
MKYTTKIYQQPFDAIVAGDKTFELRTNASYEDIDYTQIVLGDEIEFEVIAGPPFVDFTIIHNIKLVITVGEVRHYDSARTFFEQEGFAWSSFKLNSIEEAVDWIHQILEYKANIPEYGLFALEILNFEVV